MEQQQWQQWLEQSLTDLRLSDEERAQLREASAELNTDRLSFIRNRAFKLVKARCETDSAADIAALSWLERLLKTLDQAREQAVVHSEAFFSPGSDCRDAIIRACQYAQRSLDICVFTISDDAISAAILAAHRRGVLVRIISDNDKCNDKGSDIDRLAEAGIEVRLDRSAYHMHHKFAQIDGRTLINGSFNWTRSASEHNEENIVLTDNLALNSGFAAQFERLWQRFA